MLHSSRLNVVLATALLPLLTLAVGCRAKSSQLQTIAGSNNARDQGTYSDETVSSGTLGTTAKGPVLASRGLPPSSLIWNASGYDAAKGLRHGAGPAPSRFFVFYTYGSQVLVEVGNGAIEVPSVLPSPLSADIVSQAFCQVLQRQPGAKEQLPYLSSDQVVYTRRAMVADLVESPEFEHEFIAGQPAGAKLDHIYQALLGRQARPDEASPEALALVQRSYRSIAESVLSSPEYLAGQGQLQGGTMAGCPAVLNRP